MNKTLTASLLSACLLFAGGSAMAQDAMKKTPWARTR